MRLGLGFLRSKIARRIFALFLLSAIVPILLAAGLTLFQVTQTLRQQSEAQLFHTSKNYGNEILKKLQLAEARLQEIGDLNLSGSGDVVARIGHRRDGRFKALAQLDASGRLVPIFGQMHARPEFRRAALQANASQLLVLPGGAAGQAEAPSLFMMVAFGPPRAWVLAELSPDYLWDGWETLPRQTDVCVLDDRDRVLFCSLPMPVAAMLERPPSSHSGLMRWDHQGDSYIAVYRALFLLAQFNYPDWTVVSFQPASYALKPIVAFNQVFPVVIASTLLIALMLSISQIRRSLVPLEKLMEGIRDIGARRFFKPVQVSSNDEFGALTGAFNAMATRLGRQFHALDTLGQIDRLILASSGLDQIVKIALKHIPGIAPCDFAAIMMTAPENAGNLTICIKDYLHDNEPQHTSLTLPLAEKQALLGAAAPFLIDEEGADRVFLEPLHKLGARRFSVLPIIDKHRLVGIVVLGFTVEVTLSPEDIARAADLADRIAVAVTSWEREQKLYFQAYYDPLTELPNRQLLVEILDREIMHSQRQNSLVGLLFIDLDRFKTINDTMGHAAGDRLLEQAAKRLRDCIRADDTVARIGGDEFTIVLAQLPKPQDAMQVAEKVIGVLSEPFDINGQTHFVGASIGISIYPYDSACGDDLLRNADTAMYRAKHNQSGSYLFFKEEMNAELVERTKLEIDLRRALPHDEFRLWYQPQLDVRGSSIAGAEVLLRWQHPSRGSVSPALFIGLAEDIGLIEPIGAWVLRQACRQYQAWLAQGLELQRLSVNVSSRQFKQHDFVDIVEAILSETCIPPQCLELEITESLFMENLDRITHTLDRLRQLGVRLAIDDFGTGYSSLSYLNRFPVDTLKLDQAFIAKVPGDEKAGALVKAIANMAKSLQKDVVVEGVETAQQMAFVQASGCQLVQGYYLSRPLPATEFSAFISQHNMPFARAVAIEK